MNAMYNYLLNDKERVDGMEFRKPEAREKMSIFFATDATLPAPQL